MTVVRRVRRLAVAASRRQSQGVHQDDAGARRRGRLRYLKESLRGANKIAGYNTLYHPISPYNT
jgi:hypothetical protein